MDKNQQAITLLNEKNMKKQHSCLTKSLKNLPTIHWVILILAIF